MTAFVITEGTASFIEQRFSRRQQQDALNLIAADVMKPAGPGGWMFPSSDGTSAYLTSAGSCSCPAVKPCKHQCAVILREAADSSAPRMSADEAFSRAGAA